MGLFSARVFLPAFLTALLLRFGADIPVLNHFGLLLHLPHGQPTWFTSDASLIVLGVLSVAEILAQKNPEARRLLTEFDAYLKAAMSLLTSVGVMNATDANFVQQTVHQAGLTNGLIPALIAIGTFRLAIIRKEVFTAVYDHVEGTPLEHLLSWFEEAWVTFGTFFLILFPVVMLLLIGIATGVLMLVRRRLETLEEQTKVPCTNCGTSIYRCAIACSACQQKIGEPAAIGFLGQTKLYPTDDIANHPYRLAEKRRCPVCAARRPAPRPMEDCETCKSAALAEPAFAQAYLDYMSRKLPVVLGISFLFSLVPIFGLIVGTVYYRIELILPFSQYLPLGRRFLLRWGIRLLFLILIFLQWIPLLGGLVVPVMALISFTAYRSVYKSYLLTPVGEANPVTSLP